MDAGIQGTPRVYVTRSRGNRHNPYLWEFGQNAPGQFLPRHVRREEIERHDVRLVPPDIAEGLFPG